MESAPAECVIGGKFKQHRLVNSFEKIVKDGVAWVNANLTIASGPTESCGGPNEPRSWNIPRIHHRIDV